MIWTVSDEAEEWAETDEEQKILFTCFGSWYKIANIQIKHTDQDDVT